MVDVLVPLARWWMSSFRSFRAATSGTGVVTRWTYDKAGRVLTRTLPRLQAETFTYDALGRRETHVDFRGRTTTFTYHPRGQTRTPMIFRSPHDLQKPDNESR